MKKKREPALLLTEDEVEDLVSIAQEEFTPSIPWGALGDELVDWMLDRLLDRILIGEGTGPPLLDNLFPHFQDILKEEEVGAQKLRIVCLGLARKLLGVAKTRVRQRLLQAMMVLEDDLPEVPRPEFLPARPLSQLERELEEEADTVIAQSQTEEDADIEAHQMDIRREVRGEKEMLPNRIIDAIDEIDARVEASRVKEFHSSDSPICRHEGKKVSRLERDTGRIVTSCRDCRVVVSISLAKHRPIGYGTPATCLHVVKWRKGQEGKIADCVRCNVQIPNPEAFLWREVGLEPYGDDPEKDEVIVL